MMNGPGIGKIVSDEKSRLISANKSKDPGNHIRDKTDQPSCSKQKKQEQKGADSGLYGNIRRQFCI